MTKIICSIFDPNTGGPVIRARAVYENLNGDDIRAQIMLVGEKGSAFDYLDNSTVPFQLLPVRKPVLPTKPMAFLRYVLTFPFTVLQIMRYFRREKPDIVHVNGAFDFAPAFAAKLSGSRLLWHLNDTVFSAGLSRILGKLVVFLADQVVVAAEQVGRHYALSERAYVALYAPVDIDRFIGRDLQWLPDGEIRLGMVGNWNWIKGQDRFVEVVRRLHQGNKKIRATIIGKFLDSQKAYWEPIVERMKSEELQAVIEAPGFSSNIADDIRLFDVMMLTSQSEACPISVLEAMSVGVPQVVFDVGGVREILGEGEAAAGLIVPEGDIGAMVAAVDRITKDSELYRRLAVNGQKRAREIFSLENCVERHRAIYSQMMEN